MEGRVEGKRRKRGRPPIHISGYITGCWACQWRRSRGAGRGAIAILNIAGCL